MNSEPFNNVTKPRHINFHSIIPESSHHCCIAWPEAKRENSIESTENSIIFHWIHSFLCHFYVISLMVVICCLGINEETFSKNQTQSRAMENTPTGQIRVTSSFEYVCMYSWMKNSNLYVSTALVARAAAQPQHSRTLVMQKTVRLHFVIKLQTAWKIVRNIRKTICVRKSIRIYVYQWYIFFNITHVQQTKKNCKKKGLHQCRIVQGQVADQYQCCCYLHLQPISLPRSKYQRRSLHSSAEKRDLMDLHKSGKQTW